MASDPKRWWPYRIALGVALYVFIYLALFHYFPSGTDDQFISLWAGEQLAAGHGFVNHNGEPMEICSSTLHACIIALYALVGPNLVFLLNKVGGMLAGASVLCLIYLYRNTLFRRCSSPVAAYALTLCALAVNPAFLYWSMGGLETPYAALIFSLYGFSLWAFWVKPTRASAALVTAASCLYTVARPEGIFILLFTPIFAAFYSWFKGIRRYLLVMNLVPVLFFGGIVLWRWTSFGMVFPSPVYAKTGSPIEGLRGGFLYLLGYFSSSYFASFQALVLIGLTVYFVTLLIRSLNARHDAHIQRQMAGMFPYGLCLAGLLVVIVSGGDWMALARFVVPYIPLLTVVTFVSVFELIQVLQSKDAEVRRVPRGTIPITAVMIALIVTLGFRAGPDLFSLLGVKPMRQESGRINSYNLFRAFATTKNLQLRLIGLSQRHRNELARVRPIYNVFVPEILKARGKVIIITPQMGIFPYMMKKLYPTEDIYFIDLKGLCSPAIAQMDVGRSRGGAGGEKLDRIFPPNDSAISRYIHKRNPDIVFVHVMDDLEQDALRKSGWIVVENEGHPHIAYRPPTAPLSGIPRLQ